MLALFTALSVMATAQHVRIMVTGDGRSAGLNSKRSEDEDGLNVKMNQEMADAAIREHAQALLFTGDLVYGHADHAGLVKMLTRWRSIYDKDYAAGIAVLPCRGNHDAGDGSADLKAAWDEVFSGQYALPQNGPAKEKNLTYYKVLGNVVVIGLDQFSTTGDDVAINQPWLNDVLRSHHKPFIFPFAHETAFTLGHHDDGMDTSPKLRDAFWNSLAKHGTRAFFCGHDHAYAHLAVTQVGKKGPVLHEFTAGTAGAPFVKLNAYPKVNGIWNVKRVKSLTDRYGYFIVDVVGHKATVTFKARNKAGKYVPFETWSYTAK